MPFCTAKNWWAISVLVMSLVLIVIGVVVYFFAFVNAFPALVVFVMLGLALLIYGTISLDFSTPCIPPPPVGPCPVA